LEPRQRPRTVAPSPPHHPLHSFPTRRSSDLSTTTSPASDPCRHDRSRAKSRSPTSNGTATRSRRYDVLASRSISSSSALRPDDSDRKSTRLNSSHVKISYAVFCLKKKNNVPH